MDKTIHYTTVCIDNQGKVYDMRFEYPPTDWEGTTIVVNAFTCTVEECERLKKKKPKKKKK